MTQVDSMLSSMSGACMGRYGRRVCLQDVRVCSGGKGQRSCLLLCGRRRALAEQRCVTHVGAEFVEAKDRVVVPLAAADGAEWARAWTDEGRWRLTR